MNEIAIALLAIFLNKPGFYRWMALYLLAVTASWSFVVRRFLD